MGEKKISDKWNIGVAFKNTWKKYPILHIFYLLMIFYCCVIIFGMKFNYKSNRHLVAEFYDRIIALRQELARQQEEKIKYEHLVTEYEVKLTKCQQKLLKLKTENLERKQKEEENIRRFGREMPDEDVN